ncbi:TRASH domain-containing protein [Acidianus sulfidivorans JP7]|uniref:Transcriptional regulator n=1 Tax=Acidianus sulfidivorans JP7 TaxID=619593 RepID=A0A2U9IL38_9CREN|nr:TRASH domain-containing protein [Acidianus sulfidivorans]AWR96736.1 TRASH domain-containing protein [Acidianus sulfidivorans JP7]
MKLNFKINSSSPDKCEHCGMPLGDNPYTLEVNGHTHYFCCSHCADSWKKTQGI